MPISAHCVMVLLYCNLVMTSTFRDTVFIRYSLINVIVTAPPSLRLLFRRPSLSMIHDGFPYCRMTFGAHKQASSLMTGQGHKGSRLSVSILGDLISMMTLCLFFKFHTQKYYTPC